MRDKRLDRFLFTWPRSVALVLWPCLLGAQSFTGTRPISGVDLGALASSGLLSLGINANLAFNPDPGTPSAPVPPHPFESDAGWGGGSTPADLLDGFRGCNGPGGWACGLAFTGGNANWGGQACGVRQATINLGSSPMQVSAVRITHHDDEHTPQIYQIQTWNNGQWVTRVSVTNNSKSRCVRAPSYDPNSGWTCALTDEFPPVETTKVRYTFDNCPGRNSSIIPGQPITHGWLWEFEVYRLPL